MAVNLKLKLNRNWAVLGVAGLVGLAAAFSVQRYIQQRVDAARPAPVDSPTVGVVVAAGPLDRLARITSSTVAVRQVPREWAHTNSVFPDQFPAVENRRLLTPASKGEAILWSQVEGGGAATFSAMLSTGRRALTVPVDEVSSISGMLEPGDAIDLVVALRQEGKVKLLPVMQDVKVLATGTHVDAVRSADKPAVGDSHSRSFTTVTLDATPQEARRIMAAREVGKLTALLRAPGDRARQDARIEDAMGLLGVGKTGGGGAPVQVLYGGRGNAQAVRPLPQQPGGPGSAQSREAATNHEEPTGQP